MTWCSRAILAAAITWQAAALQAGNDLGLRSVEPQADAGASRLTLQRLVNPASRIEVHGRPLRFALHGLVRFDTLNELFAYIDAEAGRWTFDTPVAAPDLVETGIGH